MTLVDTKTGEKRDLKAAGLFYGIGHQPNSSLVSKRVEVDDKGYIKVQHGVSTNIPGVFAAGDLQDPEWRQAITAAGSGCQAALSAERYLTVNDLLQERASTASTHEEAAGEANHETTQNGATTSSVYSDELETFDIKEDKHKGQYALRKLYHASDRLIAVLYTSPTCGPCRSLKPIFNKVIDEFQGQVHYVEIDIEIDQEIAEAAGVAGTPTIQLFKDKEQLVSTQGVKQKSEYRDMLKKHITAAVKETSNV